MRLSGTYLDRLLINVLPWTFSLSLALHFIKGNDLKRTIIAFLITTTALWLMDTLIIFFKFNKPQILRFDEKLFWGDREILPKEIMRIKCIRDQRFRWSFNMIEVSLTDGTNFYLINKPNHFLADILGRPSMTIKRLIIEYPELDEKITGKHGI